MEDIEKELEEKTIERDQVEIKEVSSVSEDTKSCDLTGEPEPEAQPQAVAQQGGSTPVKKVKKPRSEKQIAAFEKARLKRAEGIANRKKQKEEDKLNKKLQKKEVKFNNSEDVGVVQEKSVPKPIINTTPSASAREQVIQNHYYYYGVPPPETNHQYNKSKKKKKKSKRPPTPSSSESESEEEQPIQQQPQQQQQYYEIPKPRYKFNYT